MKVCKQQISRGLYCSECEGVEKRGEGWAKDNNTAQKKHKLSNTWNRTITPANR